MMARGHATLGALGGSIFAYFPLHLDPVNSLIFVASTAGFALVPDLDEPKSTISRQFGPISEKVSRFTRSVAGGHRKATHTWPAILIMLTLGFLGMAYPWLAGILLGFSFLLGLRTVMPDYISLMQAKILPGALVVGLIAGIAGVIDPSVILYSPALGILMHSLGDWPTPQGIPWLWPKKKTYSLNWFKAGDVVEYGALIPLMLILLVVVLAVTVVPNIVSIVSTTDIDETLSFLDGYESVMNYTFD